MKKIILTLFIGAFLQAQVFNTSVLFSNGSKDKRVNLVLLGDGYTSTQQANFVSNAGTAVNYFFSKSPYKEYKNYFNSYAIEVVSAESGVKHPGTATDVQEPVFPVSNPNNYFSSSFDVNVHRCLYGNVSRVTQVLNANLPEFDAAYVMVNTPNYGGCGGQYAFGSIDAAANEIFVHELGHSFGKLADEYWFSGSGESPNKTQNNNSSTNKWRNWLGTSSIGMYPYEESPTWFRPHQSCEMRYLNQQFCAVCKQQIIERIHSLVSPIDSFTPSNSSALNGNANLSFSVTEILPIPNTLVNSWHLNNTQLSSTATNLTLTPSQLLNGTNTLVFKVYDNSSMLKVDNHSTLHLATVSWTITKSTLGVENSEGIERRYSIYPNPTNHEFYVKSRQHFDKNISAQLVDSSGKIVKMKFQATDNETLRVELKDLPSGVYIFQLKDENGVFLSEKLIKK